MRSSLPRLGFLTILMVVACGGRVGEAGEGESVAAPPRKSSAAPSAPPGPETVAEGMGIPSGIVLVGEQAVVTTSATRIGNELVQAGAVFLADVRFPKPLMLAVDRQGASWDAVAATQQSAFVGTNDGRLLEVPLRGGITRVVVQMESAIVAVATASKYVYLATDQGTVARVPETGGDLEVLGSMPGGVRALSADPAAAYVAAAEEGGATIVRFAPGEEPRVLAETDGAPCALTKQDDRLFWTTMPTSDVTNGAVYRLALSDGEAETVTEGTFAACAITADASSLYFATSAPRGLMRAPIAGGSPAPLERATQALTDPGAVAVDATHVYWLTEFSVMRLRK